jgi:hypothetical protein
VRCCAWDVRPRRWTPPAAGARAAGWLQPVRDTHGAAGAAGAGFRAGRGAGQCSDAVPSATARVAAGRPGVRPTCRGGPGPGGGVHRRRLGGAPVAAPAGLAVGGLTGARPSPPLGA